MSQSWEGPSSYSREFGIRHSAFWYVMGYNVGPNIDVGFGLEARLLFSRLVQVEMC